MPRRKPFKSVKITSAQREVARDITYARSAQTRGGRAVIRMLENATGRINLIKRAKGYDDEVAAGRNFWDVIPERYGLTLDVVGGSLTNIPANGPLILVANHPYGILDGMMMGNILSRMRGDFRILAHKIFRKAEDLDRVILPISFDETKEAVKTNLETRKTALNYLADGGAIGIFPGGTVSTAQSPMATPLDPVWRSFTAKMIAKSGATVVPVYFDGHNSRLFQIASHLHYTLRMALLIKEFRRRVDEPVRIVVGKPIPQAELDKYARDPKGMMDFLRKATYELSPKPIASGDLGFEFEENHRA
ncbi:lysophospholipid acyltransferase family protein [Halocynthiibacter namhaensis]|uniref:lysophospholipid acyltransferase family protein n=1 Tax=Halocynthiibacter namhaensis TaxID=1290553 RepID=UPI00068980AE|nr:lysophospholipid acyltransferase family protein [Halocynthiibacter namhaensis]